MIAQAIKDLMTKYNSGVGKEISKRSSRAGKKIARQHGRLKRSSETYKELAESDSLKYAGEATGFIPTSKEAAQSAMARRVGNKLMKKGELANFANEVAKMSSSQIKKLPEFKAAKAKDASLTPSMFKKNIMSLHGKGLSAHDKVRLRRSNEVRKGIVKKRGIRQASTAGIGALAAYGASGEDDR